MPTDTTPALPVVAWRVARDNCNIDEFFETYEEARVNACLGLAQTYIGALCSHTAATSALTAALARAAELERERDALREFAGLVMECWPIGDVDGGSLQEHAVKCGLLALQVPVPTEPCREEGCACAEYYSDEEWAQGVECYRKTELLTGRAAVAAVPMLPNSDLGHQSGTGGEAPSLTEPLPGTLEGAYAEGRSDEREAFRDVLRHLERPAEGWTLNTLLRAVEAAQKAAES